MRVELSIVATTKEFILLGKKLGMESETTGICHESTELGAREVRRRERKQERDRQQCEIIKLKLEEGRVEYKQSHNHMQKVTGNPTSTMAKITWMRAYRDSKNMLKWLDGQKTSYYI